MRQHRFAATGQSVSVIGLGCMGLVGWYGQRDDREARLTVLRALDLGVNHLDTAAIYQDGENERFLGGVLRGRRSEVFLATKCGQERDANGRIVVDNHPETIRRSCEASLTRLGTDYVDLFYLHRRDPAVPLAESMGAMAELVRDGKVLQVGLSEVSPATLRAAHAAFPVAALQSELSLWTRSASLPALRACQDLEIAFVAYSPLGRGFLTGTIRSCDDLPDGDTRRVFPRFDAGNLQKNQPLAASLGALAVSAGCTPAQLALAWVLAQGDNVLAIPGTKRRRYLDENVAAAAVGLTPEILAAAADAVPEDLVTGERYPESMLGSLNA